MSILFRTFVVEIRNISQTSKKQKIMNYKEAKKIQSVVYDLDAMNEESTYVAAVEHHTYNSDYSVYIYGRPGTYKAQIRACRIALAIADNSDTIVVREAEYNAGTTEVETVTAWELF